MGRSDGSGVHGTSWNTSRGRLKGTKYSVGVFLMVPESNLLPYTLCYRISLGIYITTTHLIASSLRLKCRLIHCPNTSTKSFRRLLPSQFPRNSLYPNSTEKMGSFISARLHRYAATMVFWIPAHMYQVPLTADMFFDIMSTLWVIKLPLERFSDSTKWEDGFPHLYGNFGAADVHSVEKFVRTEGQKWSESMKDSRFLQ